MAGSSAEAGGEGKGRRVSVFDGHNDVLLRLIECGVARPERAFLDGVAETHIDLPRAREGGLAGGLFAVFAPSPAGTDFSAFGSSGYDLPLPPPLAIETARAATLSMVSLLLRIERASDGQVAICRDSAAVRTAMREGRLAAVLHVEGADAIDADLHMLHVLHAAGLRSLGPVWSRPTIFGHGVPFRFPGLPDTGPGLTEAGKALVRECNALRILVDLSHLNEKGFDDVARISQAPLVASHSNAHALCPSTRNLTERQLDAIRDSDGLVGLNFATCFLRPDGQMRSDTEIDWLVRHLDVLIARLGETRVGLGSDFDGAVVPAAIGSAAGLPALFDALRARGYDEALLDRIGSGNWLDLLERTIG